jgi:hypothetical protein
MSETPSRYVLDGAGHGDLSFLGDSKSGLPSQRSALDLEVKPWAVRG